MIIQHNMLAVNANNYLQHMETQKKKSIERLSSGYQINKAADNAAGLAISEKMRGQIRGLERAAKNAEEGISFVQVADGAMQQVSNILNRMRELSIQALNDTNTAEDRLQIQKEIEQLRKEIDAMNRRTEFNSQKVFDQYKGTYYSYNGGHHWELNEIHTIDDNNNSMMITYRTKEDGEEQQMEIRVQNGKYTTDELFEIIDSELENNADSSVSFEIRYNVDKTCALEMRDGYKIEQVSGGLSYLFSSGYNGAETAFLVGTTIFYPGYPLSIVEGRNDNLSFDIENYDDTTEHIDITIPPGSYTREDMINLLNNYLKGTGMAASEYGDYSIQVGGTNGMISGLKGNMFQIDDPGSITVSVFYDNTKYGTAKDTPATLTGGAVLCESDKKHNEFHINSSNNILYMKVNSSDQTADYKQITLPEGDYSIEKMQRELQKQMDDLGLGVTVEHYSDIYFTPNGKKMTFLGLQISSNIIGEGSLLDFDTVRSTAYTTLFVDRCYDEEGVGDPEYSIDQDDVDNRASFIGYAEFPNNDSEPYRITEENNSFKLTIKELIPDASENTGLYSKESEFVITLEEKKDGYHGITEIVDEINKQINANLDMKGKIQAYVSSSNTIQLYNMHRDVCSIQASANEKNLGYETLFVGEDFENTSDEIAYGSEPKLTLPKKIPLNQVTTEDILNDKITINSSNNGLIVYVNGERREVHFPEEKAYKRQELADIITKQLKGYTIKSINNFAYYFGRGTGPGTGTYHVTGNYKTASVTCNVTGKGKLQDGSTFVEDGEPAKFLMDNVNLAEKIEIDKGNNTFKLNLNGSICTAILKEGSYSRQELADALNTALNGKVNVTLVQQGSNYHLNFETVDKGEHVTMSFGNTGSLQDSTFLDSICESERTQAVLVTDSLADSITVTDSLNTFQFQLNGKETSVKLAKGTYTKQGFVTELNKQFKAAGLGVTADLYSGCLRLTTETVGKDAALQVNPNATGTLNESMFVRTSASVTVPLPLQEEINILEDGEFRIQVNSQVYTAALKKGKYTRQELVKALNSDSNFSSVATASVNSSGQLTITTVDKGKDASIYVRGYNETSASNIYNQKEMIEALFGYSEKVIPDVTASFTDKGELLLTGSRMPNGSSYYIQARYTPDTLLEPEKEERDPTRTEASRSVKYYSLQSKNALDSVITITGENKDLEFYYKTPESTKKVQFSLSEGVYTRKALQDALQRKIDDALGAGELEVSVDRDGIKFQALKCSPGDSKVGYSKTSNNYYITSSASTSSTYRHKMSGGFYDYIMKGCIAMKESLTPSLIQGGVKLSDTYIIGRRDVKNTISHISAGDTDILKMDITFTDTSKNPAEEKLYTLNMTLEEGEYSCQDLITHIQGKLDEAVIAAGLPAHSILVDVGLFDSGVANANDENSIQFYLNPEVEWEKGDYRIDGIAGNSLPALFYSTTGDPIPAYITGTKNISSGASITAGNNIFSLKVDGITYTYEIPTGNYSESELINKLNEVFKNPDKNGNTAMIKASSKNNCLKISYRGQGIHYLSSIQGSSRSSIFYRDTMISQHSSLRLQIGANAGQEMQLQRTSISSFRLGVDTISVVSRSLAKKALKHIDKAVKYLNGERAIYGAYQNRLEHVIEVNHTADENLQNAESRIRDTDIAEEMMQYAKYRILSQAGMSMLVNANSKQEDILLLLGQ